MLKIYFVRHGQTEWNKLSKFQGNKDSNLTTLGVEQAKKLGEKLFNDNLKFDKIYSSPLTRAMLTAKLISKNSSPIHPMEEFKEISLGDMEGVLYSDFEALHPDIFFNFFNDPQKYDPTSINGENFLVLLERVQEGLAKLVNFHKESILCGKEISILVVTHGITLKAIFNFIENQGINMSNFADNPIPENTSITTVVYNNNKFIIEDFSNTDHL
ncbi:MAG: histidine phosphatase family protein [Fusobacteriaceae bacterium]